MAMCIDGVLGIQGGQNPRVLESMLKTYIDPKKRAADDKED
jgi:chemotaxis protein MotA